jgi:hypothetical protein
VLVHSFEPLDTAVEHLHDGTGGIGPVLGYGVLFFVGISVGLLSLVYYERWLTSGGRPKSFGSRPDVQLPGLDRFWRDERPLGASNRLAGPAVIH